MNAKEPKFPTKLRNDPIVEALFEVQFEGTEGVAVSELLPGMLYPALKAEMPRLVSLLPAELPKELIQKDPAFAFKASHRLDGDQYSLLVGNRLFALSCRKPYVGWPAFKSKILDVTKMLLDTGFVKIVTRFSIKYINIVPESYFPNPFDCVDQDLRLGPYDLGNRLTHLRTEIRESPYVSVIQIIPGASLQYAQEQPIKGTLLDIDTIYEGDLSKFWDTLDGLVEQARHIEKKIFFSVISEAALEKFNPVWE